MPDEPAVGDSCREDQRHRSGAGADQHAPQHDEVPPVCDEHTQPTAGGDQQEGRTGDGADAESVHQRGGERRDHAEQHQVHADGQRQQATGPSELVLQRNHQHARAGPEPRRSEQCHERHRGDDPRRVQAWTTDG
jgi:hypothetical protein